jgi:ribosomal protein S18 acetylase RimI-like enzyme
MVYLCIKRIILPVSFLLISGGAARSLFAGQEIVNYNDQRDWPSAKAIFQKNRGCYFPHDIQKPFKKAHGYLQDPQFQTKVIRVDGVSVGFINYICCNVPDTGLMGFIHLLGIDAAYRRKRYGQALLAYAINDLRKQAVLYIQLFAKKNNPIASAFYKKMGFSESFFSSDEMLYHLDCVKV